ncbi:MarR family winged helix-turn-helix transcriptional regulator [Nonomuraea dietziae]|uniref:DNA-binding MarR family transcriptional regulator n=1 Tax=Nonomuraea dietziae TaxID=65515 RepID=A0A7W5Y8Y3_9ACTN|nr:MarR family winged helix-turn-helix transcriptional regulator [Nonomuraea dietziae]MBB3725123.1 DNA-binding MarR family transcriptional regulator [Nonomuraea dietziae]
MAGRTVSDTIKAGHLVRAASQQDGRRTVLHLSPEGVELMARFRRHQRSAFEYVTAGWPERERLEFARLPGRHAAEDRARHRRRSWDAREERDIHRGWA